MGTVTAVAVSDGETLFEVPFDRADGTSFAEPSCNRAMQFAPR